MKAYIGDGVYAEYDGYSIVLTTENGITTTNTIYLEPDVLRALKNFADAAMSLPLKTTDETR